MLKLHLGCGNKHIDGYTNIDIRYQPGVDAVDNIKFLRKYAENSVDVLYACHVLEHFSRWEIDFVLERWYYLLAPNGILRVCVPDFESICKYYLSTKRIEDIRGMMYGGQEIQENFHYWIWDFDTLMKELLNVGFKKVKKYDWRTTDHCDVDDYSQSYLPHLDKNNGQLMSLNIEATKI